MIQTFHSTVARKRAFAAAYRAAVMADSPTAYWRLGEASGTTAADETGSYDGTYVGSPTLGASGIFTGDTAVTFTGSTSEEVTVPLAAATGTSGTFEAWVNPSVTGVLLCIFSSSTEADVDHYLRFEIEQTTGVMQLVWRDGAGTADQLKGTTVIPTSSWTHLAFTSDGAEYIFYLNGASDTIKTTTGSNSGNWFSDATTRVNAKIGLLTRTSSIIPFNGSIDEVAIYPTALSAARIAAHYAAAGY